MFQLLSKILGDPNKRLIDKITPAVDYINTLELDYAALSDDELAAKTAYFRNILHNRDKSGDSKRDRELEDAVLYQILPDAFATVREAGKRVLNMRHYNVQLVGGYVLHQGKISEMRTGEGKTLVATLPAYLNALTGKGVHIVTVNDYLAKRDSEWMGQIYQFLGLDVGLILSGGWSNFKDKKNAYNADITYGTNNEFGFDYLRDNMASSINQCCQREFNYAIIDEVDSILIDEARTPLIISGRLEKSAETYRIMSQVALKLSKETDYITEEKTKNIILNEEGIDKAQEILEVDDLYDMEKHYAHHLMQALRAKEFYHHDVDYVIKDNQVVIVDEFTGRLMEGRRWSDGLHQAVEAKEGVKIQDETQTLASITFQNLFRLYPKLAGMTGTAKTEELEFEKIYNLSVVQIPTNKQDQRVDHPDVIFKNVKSKFDAIADEIAEINKTGRPILVGTISIEKSEYLSNELKKRKIPHNVLNAKHHEKEAVIIAQAGRYGAVTIATNMAGRGTDIILGGNAELLAKTLLEEKGFVRGKVPDETYDHEVDAVLTDMKRLTKEEHVKVVEAGGLHVIGTERHESRRIDNQLRGRCARQGDQGSTRFYLSLEDDLMRIFGGEKIANLMNMLKADEDMAIESSLLTNRIEAAQKRVETYHFDIRKSLLKFDDVMNEQRLKLYDQRRKVLLGKNVSEDVVHMIHMEVQRAVLTYMDPSVPYQEWEDSWFSSTLTLLTSIVPQFGDFSVQAIKGVPFDKLLEKLQTFAVESYQSLEQGVLASVNDINKLSDTGNYQEQTVDMPDNIMRDIEREVLLKIVDDKWVDHLRNMDALRDGINLRAYGQKDPLIEYKREAFDMFNCMIYDIQKDVVTTLFRTKIKVQLINDIEDDVFDTRLTKAAENALNNLERVELAAQSTVKKVGRNDPCLCGSGLKYKKCCGVTSHA